MTEHIVSDTIYKRESIKRNILKHPTREDLSGGDGCSARQS